MTGLPTGLILGILLALLYAFLFHLLVGGSLWRLALTIITSLFGFVLGQIGGQLFNPNGTLVGMLYLPYATIGSILAQIGMDLLTNKKM